MVERHASFSIAQKDEDVLEAKSVPSYYARQLIEKIERKMSQSNDLEQGLQVG